MAGKGPLERVQEELMHDVGNGDTLHSLGMKSGVDRRKLKKLYDGQDQALTFRELGRLNDYLFETRGRGMSAMFDPPSVTRQIAKHGNVTFILGSQPEPEARRMDLSRWDLQTLQELLRAINATGRTVNLNIEDVIFRPGAEETFAGGALIPDNEAWHHLLSPEGPSIVCIGSPKACHAAEVMLARMFDVPEFDGGQERADPPFFFVWADHDKRAQQIKSTFMRSAREAAGSPGEPMPADIHDDESRSCAYFDGKLHAVERDDSRSGWDTYGLVAAQRRPGNQIWLVLAGLTGPATLGAARAIREFRTDLPSMNGSGVSHTVWTTVKSRVDAEPPKEFRHDQRHVNQRPVFGDLRYYPPLIAGQTAD